MIRLLHIYRLTLVSCLASPLARVALRARSGISNFNEFEVFLGSTQINYCRFSNIGDSARFNVPLIFFLGLLFLVFLKGLSS